MEQRQCTSCNAMVGATKAFCPECGNPMEQEEQRISLSDIDKLTITYRLDEEQFWQMLKEMKLSPEATEVVLRQTMSQPSVKQTLKKSDFKESKSSKFSLKILIIAGVLFFLLIILILELLFLF